MVVLEFADEILILFAILTTFAFTTKRNCRQFCLFNTDITLLFCHTVMRCGLTIILTTCYDNGSNRPHRSHRTDRPVVFVSLRQCAATSDMELGHWVTGSICHLGHRVTGVRPARVFPVFEKSPK